MAKPVTVPQSNDQASRLTESRVSASRKIQDQIDKGKVILNRPISDSNDLGVLRRDFYKWSDYNEELLRRLFTTSHMVDKYTHVGIVIGFSNQNLWEEIKEFQDDVTTKIDRLESILARLELIPEPHESDPAQGLSAPMVTSDVFVVHGHDNAVKQEVARTIEKLGLKAIVLHEQTNQGRTIIEKFEKHANVAFAVVLLTPDDIGGVAAAPKQTRTRARQNVILELGYFLGRLGRDRVCALYKKDLELPSDLLGVAYVEYDIAGAWRLSLAKELQAAGLPVDLNKL